MLKKLYIGNLPFDTTEAQVRELFAPYGDVFVVDMVMDFDTDQFRGFGFVEMEEEAADAALVGLKGHKIEGRNIKISEARSDKVAPGNHPGSNLHLRTSRSLFDGANEFGRNGRRDHGGRNEGGGRAAGGARKANDGRKGARKDGGAKKGRKKRNDTRESQSRR